MKKILLALLVGAFSFSAAAQTATVTGTATDSDGQTWNNGTWRAVLVSPNGPPTINRVPVSPTTVTGSFNGSGALSTTLTRTDALDQGGATWQFTICPNASADCAAPVSTTIAAASVSISSVLSTGLAGPRFNASTTAYGYLDVEVNTANLNDGQTYFNVTNQIMRSYSEVTHSWSGAGGSPNAAQIAAAIQAQSGCNTAGNVWVPQSNTCVPQSGAGGTPAGASGSIQYNNSGSFGALTPTARTNLRSSQFDIESTAISTAYSIWELGDSNCASAGVAAPANGFCNLLAARLGLANSSGIAPNNLAVAGDNAQDESFRFYNSALNPSDAGNPILTSVTVTNNVSGSTGGIVPFQQAKFGTYVGATISSSDKILAGNVAVTQAGTWTADTTFTNTPGLTSSTAGSTLTYTAYVGLSGAFYVPYRNLKAGPNGVFFVSIDGTPATDTVSNSTNVNTNWAVLSNNTTTAVGAARYVTTPGSHTVVVNYVSGTINILGFFFPPTLHYRGGNAPRIFAGAAIPQQNDANGSTVRLYNAALLSVVQTLVADGLQVQYVDLYNGGIDPVRDMSSTTIQGCVASTNPGLHMNICGHNKAAGLMEAAIGAVVSPANSNLTAPLNTIGIPSITTLNTQANGLDTNSYNPAGANFPKGSWCWSTFSSFCWGATMLGNGGGPFRNILLANTGSGRFSFSFAPTNATPSQVISGIVAELLPSGALNLPQITFTGSAPTMAAGAAAGTGPNCTTITGTNMAGQIGCTTGSATTTGVLSTVTFAGAPIAVAPQSCRIMPTNANAAPTATAVWVSTPTTSGFTINVVSALTATTGYTWSYNCI